MGTPTRAEFARALKKMDRRITELREDFDELRDTMPAAPAEPAAPADAPPDPAKKNDDWS